MAINTAKLNYTLIYDGKDTLLRFGIESFLEESKKTYGENFIDFDFTNTQSDSSSYLMVGDKNKSDNVSLKWNSDKKSIDVTIHQDEDFNTDAKAYLSINFLYKVITKVEGSTGFTNGYTGATVTNSPIDISFFVRSSNHESTKGKPNPSVEPYYVPKVLEEKTNVKTETDPVDLEAIIGSVDGSDILATIGDVNFIVKDEIQRDKISNLHYTPNVPPERQGGDYSLEYDEDSYYLSLKKDGLTKSSVYLASLKTIFSMPSDYDREKNFGENIKHYLNSGKVESSWINSLLINGPDQADEVSGTILSNQVAWSKISLRVSADGEKFELTFNSGLAEPLVLMQFPVSLIAGAVNKNLYTKQEVDTLIDNLRKELKPDS